MQSEIGEAHPILSACAERIGNANRGEQVCERTCVRLHHERGRDVLWLGHDLAAVREALLAAEAHEAGMGGGPEIARCLLCRSRRGLPVPCLFVRLFYVDDSGNESMTTFSAVSLPVQAWTTALGAWLDWRRHLQAAYQVDVQQRLHAVGWLAGRGRPSSNPKAAINHSKPIRWREFACALEAIAKMPGVEIMMTFAPGDPRRPTYRALMERIDQRLRDTGDHGLIVIDGENGDLQRHFARLPHHARYHPKAQKTAP